ncbi:hypothetical protein [Morganella morganii]|uniref:Uncharacterized protein n=1 Tax=Morganella morganii TaxID=582 RepID=A0A6B7Q225_MORMO|nr:hypothetical protein [Morganella morganii]HBT7313286.1 hypothetical protein [Klebsiella pneumoniae]EKW8501135.1 hypothetical protein [Morganella morganii]ELB1544633.1 hypothetical protein [Morganella morganii]MBS9572201.1 hypothetical protein [Morganella morganii subsp. morganii]MBS9585599.1 hypothetical protein [Morganella morganii subsp. morganii]
MKKKLISIILLFPVLSVAAGNSTIDVNPPEKLTEISNKIDDADNESFLIAYNRNNLQFTPSITPVKDIKKCEKLKSLLEQPEIKRQIYYGDVKFQCLTIGNDK